MDVHHKPASLKIIVRGSDQTSASVTESFILAVMKRVAARLKIPRQEINLVFLKEEKEGRLHFFQTLL